MHLKVLSTGSKSNGYLLQGEGSSLLLDAGLQIAQISKGISFHGLSACLVTHEHQDHAKAARDLARRGITVIASAGTAAAIGLQGPFYRPIKAGESTRVNNWTILAFETQHDAAEPIGFLIRNEVTGESIIYATDTYYLKYRFPGTHYWLIECNYTEESLDRQVANGTIDEELKTRLTKSHMSLERLITALQANDLSDTRLIVLVHLSDTRSDERYMTSRIEHFTGKPTVAAHNGDSIDLELTPF